MSDIPYPGALPASPLPSGPRRYPWYHWRRFGLNFLTISVAAHLLFGLGATYLIVQTIQAKRKQTFTGPPQSPNAPTRAIEHKVQMQKKQQTMSAPAPVKRITTTSNARVALPAMPVMSKTDSAVVPMAMAGMGGTGVGLGMGTGGGGGSGGGGGGLNIFGLRTGGIGLLGTFYDLKQTKDAQPTSDMASSIDEGPMNTKSPANLAYRKIIGQLILGGLNEGMLGRYFRGPNPLYTRQIFVPSMNADNGPKAFNLQDKVRPRRWVVVYRGQVTPPESGSYRFVGWADDILAVTFNHRMVLDGSLCNPSKMRPKTTYHYADISSPFFASDPVNITGGEAVPITVAIGEEPGGNFNAFLLLEKVGENYTRSKEGAPILPILKFAAGPNPSAGSRGQPEVAPDASWSVWKSVPAAAVP